MQIIQNNPYRVLGLLVGATAAEQRRQLTRLQRFIEAEQEPEDNFSFPTLGNLNRTIDKVNEATAKLNLNIDKMNAALFWFYKGNPITDEPAFDSIKEADLDQVLSIWSKLTSNGEVSQRNASAYSNLGTLYLSGILEGTNSNEALFEKGILLKLKFLESDFVKELKVLATDETFKTTKKELQLLFLNQVQDEVENSGKISSNKLLEILTKQDFSAKEDFLKGFVQKPIEQIEKKINETKAKRNANKSNALEAGNELYEQIIESIKQLKSILGASNIKFSSISDKISAEILQCGIDYFSHYKDSKTDPGEASMDLFRKAKTLAVGNIATQRWLENTENLQKWLNNKPERDKQARILVDFEKLNKLILSFENRSNTVENAEQLLENSRFYLNNIKNILGSTDDLYLTLSSRIASDAMGMCVSEINKLQEQFTYAYDNTLKLTLVISLKGKVDEAWDVVKTIDSMNLKREFIARFSNNKASLSKLKEELKKVNTGNSGGDNTGGCYIATMAYGDYNHSQVRILRKFRDEVLDKSAFGKWFIKTYYYYSPKLVELVQGKIFFNTLIRFGLNILIKFLKK